MTKYSEDIEQRHSSNITTNILLKITAVIKIQTSINDQQLFYR